MIRRLAAVALLVVGFFLLRRFLRLLFTPAASENRERLERDGETQLVRDKVCNTFIPRSRALVLKDSREPRFFCSVECRTRYLAGSMDSKAGIDTGVMK